jgi:CubicO group peptidase (beta-lactamase class C family)
MGIDKTKVDDLLLRARREIDAGLLPSCQLALAQDGEVVVSETFGDAMPDTRYVIFSATKPLVAGAVWLLIGEGKIDPSERVAEVLSEFGENGKDQITIEQVMLHTSGFPAAPMGPPAWDTSEGRRQRFAQWRLNWDPGTKYEYHPTSAHWVLAELIMATTGQDYRDFIKERILNPLGLSKLRLGVPANEQGDIAEIALVGEPTSPDEMEKVLGIRELPVTEVTDDALLGFNTSEVRAVGVPGGGGVSTASDLAMYYQALLHNTGKLWDSEVLADVTSRVRNRIPDQMMGVEANRSLGLVIAGDDGKSNLRGMGRTVGPRTFGHNGAMGQIAWADPDSGLSFVYLTNGRDLNFLRENRRTTALASLAAVCAS